VLGAAFAANPFKARFILCPLLQRLVEFLAVIAQARETRGKAMHDRQQVLHHFLFWRELFVVEDKQLGPVLGAETLEPRKAQSHADPCAQ
jgi:hypothetical protein